LNHRKKTKADGSRLIPRKHTETLVLLSEQRLIDKKNCRTEVATSLVSMWCSH